MIEQLIIQHVINNHTQRRSTTDKTPALKNSPEFQSHWSIFPPLECAADVAWVHSRSSTSCRRWESACHDGQDDRWSCASAPTVSYSSARPSSPARASASSTDFRWVSRLLCLARTSCDRLLHTLEEISWSANKAVQTFLMYLPGTFFMIWRSIFSFSRIARPLSWRGEKHKHKK